MLMWAGLPVAFPWLWRVVGFLGHLTGVGSQERWVGWKRMKSSRRGTVPATEAAARRPSPHPVACRPALLFPVVGGGGRTSEARVGECCTPGPAAGVEGRRVSSPGQEQRAFLFGVLVPPVGAPESGPGAEGVRESVASRAGVGS